jgi:hypothetical protein
VKYILASILFVISAQAAAQTYVVGVEQAAFMPHYSVDAKGQYQGFARELFDLFAAESGIQLIYKPLPVADLLPALLDGSVDFKYPDNPSWADSLKAGHTLSYSEAVVDYVDGVMVAPRRVGLGVDQLKRLAIVDGWTPWGYETKIDAKQIMPVHSGSLPQMIRQALLKNTDGAYYNVVVAIHYLDNIRARPGALVFDPDLPHTRSTYRLSSIRHPELIQRFDRFLTERQSDIAALKAKYQVEANIGTEYFGMEQWKVDFLKRQKAREASGD